MSRPEPPELPVLRMAAATAERIAGRNPGDPAAQDAARVARQEYAEAHAAWSALRVINLHQLGPASRDRVLAAIAGVAV